MVVDEKEFRSFIGNTDRYFKEDINYDEYKILRNKILNQLTIYKNLLNNQPEKSKWSQLKLKI
jgi:hypothetical protein